MDPRYFKPASETLVQKVKECTQIDHFVTLDTLFQTRDFIFLHVRVDKSVEKLALELSQCSEREITNELTSAGVEHYDLISTQGFKEILLQNGFEVKDKNLVPVVKKLHGSNYERTTYIDLARNKGTFPQ